MSLYFFKFILVPPILKEVCLHNHDKNQSCKIFPKHSVLQKVYISLIKLYFKILFFSQPALNVDG